MSEHNDAEEVRLTYMLEAIFGEKVEISRGGDGRYTITVTGDYNDIGSVQGEALMAAGYAIVGAHKGDRDSGNRDRIENYTVVSLDRLERDWDESGCPYYGNAR